MSTEMPLLKMAVYFLAVCLTAVDADASVGPIWVVRGEDYEWNLKEGELRFIESDRPAVNEWIWKHDNNLWHGAYPKDTFFLACPIPADPVPCDSAPVTAGKWKPPAEPKPWDETAPLAAGNPLIVVIPWFTFNRSDLDVEFEKFDNDLTLKGAVTIPQIIHADLRYPEDFRHEFVFPIEDLPVGNYTLTVQLDGRFACDHWYDLGPCPLPFSHVKTIQFSVIPEPSMTLLFGMAIAVFGRLQTSRARRSRRNRKAGELRDNCDQPNLPFRLH